MLFTCMAKPQSMYFCWMCFLTTRRRWMPAVALAVGRRTEAGDATPMPTPTPPIDVVAIAGLGSLLSSPLLSGDF